MHHRARDLTGQTLGYLKAISYAGSMGGKKSMWLVRCVCGTEREMDASEFVKQQKRGIVASCGCKRRETIARRRTTHGMSRHAAFAVWRSMLARCTNPKHQAWPNYGGRGITVCERWVKSFTAFWDDMGPTYREGLTLERRDNELGYGPENCVWVTWRKQARNKRTNSIVQTPWGLMTAADAADRAGLNRSTVYYRIASGWPDNMLLLPPDSGRRLSTIL